MLQMLAATTNKNKVREFQKILQEAGSEIVIVPQNTISGLPEIIEDGKTFKENAMKKAREISKFTDMAVIADDSGLAVDALDGAPGIYSARYAGEGANDSEKIAKLLKNMKGISNREAKFVCVAAIACKGKEIAHFTGEIRGTIAEEPSGTNGFGYDPVFLPENSSRTFAEYSDAEKNAVSHRGKAMRAAAEFLRNNLAKLNSTVSDTL